MRTFVILLSILSPALATAQTAQENCMSISRDLEPSPSKEELKTELLHNLSTEFGQNIKDILVPLPNIDELSQKNILTFSTVLESGVVQELKNINFDFSLSNLVPFGTGRRLNYGIEIRNPILKKKGLNQYIVAELIEKYDVRSISARLRADNYSEFLAGFESDNTPHFTFEDLWKKAQIAKDQELLMELKDQITKVLFEKVPAGKIRSKLGMRKVEYAHIEDQQIVFVVSQSSSISYRNAPYEITHSQTESIQF